MLATATSVAPAATPEQIDAAIHRGAAFLKTRENKFGNWETHQDPPWPNAAAGADGMQWGGRTALGAYALLAAGERPLDPVVAKPVDWLRNADIRGNYALGLRANVWFFLPQTPANLGAMNRDNAALHKGVVRPHLPVGSYGFSDPAGRQGVLFDYLPGGERIDLSCSQYGVLGCWAAAQRLPEAATDRDFWERVEAAWVYNANRDGGWAYNGLDSGESTMAMTAAGVATLFITQELAHANDDGKKRQIENAEGARRKLEDGLKWIADHLPGHLSAPDLYALYGIERIGVASGYKYFGQVNWFDACADVLVHKQLNDGSWGGQFDPEINTSFALLFLSRGRSPIIANKLAYHITAPRTGKEAESNWDRRPRDIANVARWVEDKTERRLNWQIVDLDVASVDDFHDSGLLYVTTDRVLALTADEKSKLKQYVEEGGLILFNADHGAAEVGVSVRALGHELFPDDKFEPLEASANTVLRSQEQFPVGGQKRPVKVEALSNGARILMLLVPSDDLSTTFQRRNETGREAAYQFFANAYLYSTEKIATRYKGQTHIVRPIPTTAPTTEPATAPDAPADPQSAATQPTASITVARVKYDGRWNPEPGGWRRLFAVVHNESKVDLQITPWDPATPPPADCRIAHCTGVDTVKWTDAQRRGVRKFIKEGGLLLVDACGGGTAFDASVRAEIEKMFYGSTAELVEPLAANSPIFTDAAGKPVPPEYRAYGLATLGPLVKAYQLRGVTVDGKLGVLLSDQDLSVGLVGQPVDGIIGYTPAVATSLVRRIIELKTAGKI